jgi:hypothetical protein
MMMNSNVANHLSYAVDFCVVSIHPHASSAMWHIFTPTHSLDSIASIVIDWTVPTPVHN